jgi:hypothetical protein
MGSHHSLFLRAMGATIKIASRFDAMADDFAAAMFARRGLRMDGAFKAVVIMGDAVDDDFQILVVFVSANFALGHDALLSLRLGNLAALWRH